MVFLWDRMQIAQLRTSLVFLYMIETSIDVMNEF